jgi:HPt (histidine-containing phosphotransfer) domain-containing protein
MGSTKRRPRQTALPAEAEDDGFESLRLAFQARLESERVHFVTLSAALARADENPAWIFEDLQYRAHRLQGGAAIFDEAEVALAAEALEQAAVAAAQTRADNTDENVWSALVTLVRLMGGHESARASLQAQ